VSVEVDLLEAHDQFLESATPEHVDVGITDLKLVVPFNQKLEVVGVGFIEL